MSSQSTSAEKDVCNSKWPPKLKGKTRPLVFKVDDSDQEPSDKEPSGKEPSNKKLSVLDQFQQDKEKIKNWVTSHHPSIVNYDVSLFKAGKSSGDSHLTLVFTSDHGDERKWAAKTLCS